MTTNELSPEEVRDSKIYIEWGLTEQEYDLIVKELKRLPNFTETGIFSGMWSEHVSYKKSKQFCANSGHPTNGFYRDPVKVLEF
ncbi:MAG: hypothetical protein ACFWTU_06085 [Leuconostoc mesenteroides]